MQLTETQSHEIFTKHGVYVTEACDRCGKILGALRYTRYGKPGEWCSQICRDGLEQKAGACQFCGTALNGKRKGACFCSDVCRKRLRVRERRNNAETRLQNTALRGTILRPSYGDSLNLEKGPEPRAIAQVNAKQNSGASVGEG